MSLLRFFRKNEPAVVNDLVSSTLGCLKWSLEEEAWAGAFQGIEFCIFPAKNHEPPSQDLLSYAESILTNPPWLLHAISAEKEKYLALHPEFRSELQDLRISALAFSEHKKKGLYLNCQLGFGAPDRFWSLDFHGSNCSGLGFDS